MLRGPAEGGAAADGRTWEAWDKDSCVMIECQEGSVRVVAPPVSAQVIDCKGHKTQRGGVFDQATAEVVVYRSRDRQNKLLHA